MAPEGKRRQYRMVARAAAAARTRERILDAVLALASQRFVEEISLADVAGEAGVTVQTVLRHFEGREALLEAAARRGDEAVEAVRRRVRPGDIGGIARRVVGDYERFGDTVMLSLAQEGRVPFVRPIVERGRSLHHAWIDSVFEPHLARRQGLSRARLRAQLIVATDVYTWKLLRRDLRLSRRQTELAIGELIQRILEDRSEEGA